MASENKLQGNLSIDVSEAEKSLRTIQDFVKATSVSLKELSQIKVGENGQLINSSAINESTDAITKHTKARQESTEVTKSAEQELKTFYREQRVQDRTIREAREALLGFTIGMASLFSQSGESSEGVKKFENVLITTISSIQGAEFASVALGIALSNIGGGFATVGAMLSRFATPISIIVGIGAGLVTFFQKSNDEAKKAAEDGLKRYSEMLDKIAGKMDDFTAKTLVSRRIALSTELNQVEARLKIYKELSEAGKSGGKEVKIDITQEEAAKAGIHLSELIQLKGKELQDQMTLLRERARELATEINSLPNTITAKKPVINKDDAKKEAEDRLNVQKEMDKSIVSSNDAYKEQIAFEHLLFEAGKQTKAQYIEQLLAIQKRAGVGEISLQIEAEINKLLKEDTNQTLQEVQLRYQMRSISAASAITQLQALEKETTDTLEIAKIRKAIFDIQQDAAQKQQQSIDDQAAQAQRIASALQRAFSKSGDTLISKLAQALEIASAIAKTVAAANAKKDGASIADYVEIGANIATFFAMFDSGGHTGYGNPNQIAGAVHYDEIVFENSITKKYRSQLLALRSQLQTGKEFSFATPGINNGGAFFNAMASTVSPSPIDLSSVVRELRSLQSEMGNNVPQVTVNIKNPVTLSKALEVEIPVYERFKKSKYIDQ